MKNPRYDSTILGRLHWAAGVACHAKPKSTVARVRLFWHDFVIHALLNSGGERCEDCGRPTGGWRTSDADWNWVVGNPGGLLCRSCFAERRLARVRECA